MVYKGKDIIYKMLTENKLFLIWVVGLVFVTYYVCVFNSNVKPSKQIENFTSGPQQPLSEYQISNKSKNKEGQCGKLKDVTEKCHTCHGKDGNPLLPVLEPMFNMREMCKQIILLEDHLFQKEKRCEDCICKHFLTIEALAEEAVTLDKNKEYTEYLEKLPTKIRNIQKKYLEYKDNINDVAQDLRAIRKEMMIKSFSYGLNIKDNKQNLMT